MITIEHIIIPERSEGYTLVPIELFVRACVRAACLQKVLILQIFNRLFLPAAASLGYQTFYRFGGRRVLPGCGQLVPVLRQVRA